MSDVRLLLVEDDPDSASLIRMKLDDLGYLVDHVLDGHTAIALYPKRPYDLILLDNKIPHMSGLDVAREILARDSTATIVMVTGHGSESVAVEAMKTGVYDYIVKDGSGDFFELLPAVVDRALEHRRLVSEQKVLREQVDEFQGRIKSELNLASAMQEELLPASGDVRSIAEKAGFRISHRVRTSSELGGDLWGISEIGNGRFVLYVADFAGRGVHAALNTFRLHTVLGEYLSRVNNPAEFLTILNERMRDLLPEDHFVTMFCGLFDRGRDLVTFATAGSPPLLFGNREDPAALEQVSAKGEPLGVEAGVTFENQWAPFRQGDFVLIHSDGLLSAVDREDLSDDDLQIAVTECLADGPSDDIVEALLERIPSGRDERPSDDVTVLSVERTAP